MSPIYRSSPGRRLGCRAVVAGLSLAACNASVVGAQASLAQPPSCEGQSPLLLPPSPDESQYGAKILRTMTLLATSSPSRRNTVRILVYGQSISAGMKSSCLEAELRRRFPHANLVLENNSISGFSADQLVRSAAVDIPLAYPDLIVFHDYGAASIEYERMFADIRRRTTAEIMVWTDHHGDLGPPDSAGYEARFAREGHASDVVRALAVKYNVELVDARAAWGNYLQASGKRSTDLLQDAVHLNASGKALMTALIMQHFRLNLNATNDWMNTVRSYEAKRQPDEGASDEIVFAGEPWQFRSNDAIGTSPRGRLLLKFTGNRVDLIPGATDGLKLGTARVRIDGRAPSAHPELYAFTLPSPAFGADHQPGIRRVSHIAPLHLEDWVLRVTAARANGFDFEVRGSKTGFDGSGSFDLGRLKRGAYGTLHFTAPDGDLPQRFVSRSRRVVIEHRDLKVLFGQDATKRLSPVGFEIRWKVVPQFLDHYEARPPADPSLVQPITLAKGLSNGEHTLEIIPTGDGAVPIREIVVHRPPLR